MSEGADQKEPERGSEAPEQAPSTTSGSVVGNDSQIPVAEQGEDSSRGDESVPAADDATVAVEPEEGETESVAEIGADRSEQAVGKQEEVAADAERSIAESREEPGEQVAAGAAPAADFAQMVDQSDVGAHSKDVKVGDKVNGVLGRIGEELSFVDFGGRSEGVIKTVEIRPGADQQVGEAPTLSEGDPLEAYVMSAGEEIVLSRSLQSENSSADMLYQAFKSGIPVEGKVIAVNKWGLGVDVNGCRAFCPISQIDTEFVSDTAPYKDQSLTFKITEFRNQGRNIVVSRRALLQADADDAAATVREGIVKGAEMDGTVTRLEPFGAFVELGGGVEGLIHVSELSHQRVEHPKDVLETGQEVRVSVIRVKDLGARRKERISLSLKALEKDPWSDVKAKYPPGTFVKGKVESLEDFGAFVQLDENVSGRVHVSEIADKRIKHPREVVSVGDEVTVAVLELDSRRQRLRLSIKQVESLEDAANLKDFNARQKEKKDETPAGNALTDALKRAGLN